MDRTTQALVQCECMCSAACPSMDDMELLYMDVDDMDFLCTLFFSKVFKKNLVRGFSVIFYTVYDVVAQLNSHMNLPSSL